MKQKELTKTFMMILNGNNPFGLHNLYNIKSTYVKVNHLTAKLFNLNFHPLEVLSR